MDRLEQNHELLARDVTTLSATVARVELNQTHAADLNKLRFDALDVGLGTLKSTLDAFMARINGVVSGEIKLPQAVQGEQLVADYLAWRKVVDGRLEDGERARLSDSSSRKGVFETLGVGRSVVLFGISLVGGALAVADVIARLHP